MLNIRDACPVWFSLILEIALTETSLTYHLISVERQEHHVRLQFCMPQKISGMMKIDLIIWRSLKYVLMNVILKILSLSKKVIIPNMRS